MGAERLTTVIAVLNDRSVQNASEIFYRPRKSSVLFLRASLFHFLFKLSGLPWGKFFKCALYRIIDFLISSFKIIGGICMPPILFKFQPNQTITAWFQV